MAHTSRVLNDCWVLPAQIIRGEVQKGLPPVDVYMTAAEQRAAELRGAGRTVIAQPTRATVMSWASHRGCTTRNAYTRPHFRAQYDVCEHEQSLMRSMSVPQQQNPVSVSIHV